MRRTGLKFIGMATAVAVLLAAGAAYAQSAPAPGTTDAAPAADTTKAKAKPKVKPKTEAAADTKKTDKMAAKPKAKKLPMVSVIVTNGRSVGLVELTATMSGGTADSVTAAKKLAAGKKATVKLAHDKDCMFDLHGVFDDGQMTDVSGVDLCKDKTINLTD